MPCCCWSPSCERNGFFLRPQRGMVGDVAKLVGDFSKEWSRPLATNPCRGGKGKKGGLQKSQWCLDHANCAIGAPAQRAYRHGRWQRGARPALQRALRVVHLTASRTLSDHGGYNTIVEFVSTFHAARQLLRRGVQAGPGQGGLERTFACRRDTPAQLQRQQQQQQREVPVFRHTSSS